MADPQAWLKELEACAAVTFVAQVRVISNELGDLVQRELDKGYSLSAVQDMLRDVMARAQRVKAVG